VTPELRSGESVCGTAECAAECLDDACNADFALGCTADDDCASDERCHRDTRTCVELPGPAVPACGANKTDEACLAATDLFQAPPLVSEPIHEADARR
jgi:hypothetical protein